MVLVQKFLAPLLLVALFATGPLCTCAFAIDVDLPMEMTGIGHSDHVMGAQMSEDCPDIDNCQDHCTKQVMAEAKSAPFKAAAVSAEKTAPFFMAVGPKQAEFAPKLTNLDMAPPGNVVIPKNPVSLHTVSRT